jgi:hypothetical protein
MYFLYEKQQYQWLVTAYDVHIWTQLSKIEISASN